MKFFCMKNDKAKMKIKRACSTFYLGAIHLTQARISGMIFQTKFCAITTSKVECFYVDDIESIIQEIYLIQQHCPGDHGVHGWPQELQRVAKSGVQACGTHSTAENGSAQRCQIGGAFGGSRYWQPTAMAYWYSSWGEPGASPSVSR